jgi:hypothetical protein
MIAEEVDMDRRLLCIVAGAALGLSACGRPAPLAPPGGEAPLRFSQVTPSPGSALTKGSPVELDLTVASDVSAAGQLTLSVRDQHGHDLLASAPSVEIGAGGSVTFEVHFVVPATASSVQATIDFQPLQPSTSKIVLIALYPTR